MYTLSSNIELSASDLLTQTWIVNSKSFKLTELGWKIKLNDCKATLGTCNFNTKTICISKYLLGPNADLTDVWLDTIKHEISHAIDFETRGCSDHGFYWRQIAVQVGCIPHGNHFGAELIDSNPKYTVKCIHCKKETKKYRMFKEPIACKPCCVKYNSGKFTTKFILQIIQHY